MQSSFLCHIDVGKWLPLFRFLIKKNGWSLRHLLTEIIVILTSVGEKNNLIMVVFLNNSCSNLLPEKDLQSNDLSEDLNMKTFVTKHFYRRKDTSVYF